MLVMMMRFGLPGRKVLQDISSESSFSEESPRAVELDCKPRNKRSCTMRLPAFSHVDKYKSQKRSIPPPGPEFDSAIKDDYLKNQVSIIRGDEHKIYDFGLLGFIAFSNKLFHGEQGGIYCVYHVIMVIEYNKRRVGYTTAEFDTFDGKNEVDLLISEYKLKGGIFFLDLARLLSGNFNCSIYDSTVAPKRVLILHCSSDSPIYYGSDKDGSTIISYDFDVLKKFVAFPHRSLQGAIGFGVCDRDDEDD